MALHSGTTKTKHSSAKLSKRLMIAVRIRPLNADEVGRVLHSVDDKVVVLEENEADKNDTLRHNRGSDRQYVFDAVFGEDSSQETIFQKTTQGLVKDVLEGFNSTIFAYGASGSGKTHTMLGTTSEPGIMVRALHEIFNFVRNNTLQQRFGVTMSYLEIYNENIRDLLNPDSGFLELREDQKDKTVKVVGLNEVTTNSTEEMMRLLQKGNKARTMEPTALNQTSSRSHALLSITVRQIFPMQKNEKLRARVKQGKLFMIDLAGSERASQTKNRGKRLVEGAHINRSLLALGNCINALSGGAHYVNYRDSKLTRLLKDALSGNSQTCMIAHISPATSQREESKNTLVYADRAKSISNKVRGKNVLDISYHVSQYRTIISELRDEIARLKSKMPEDEKTLPKNNKKKQLNSIPNKLEKTEGLDQLLISEDRITSLKNEIISTFKEQMKLRKRMLNIEGYLLELDWEAERQHAIIAEWEGKSSRLYRNPILLGKKPEKPNLGSLDLDYQELESDSRDKALSKALMEITLIEKEQEKYSEMRAVTDMELEKCKEKATLLEKELPYEITSEEERELISLIIRVHELEIDKIVSQSEKLTKEHIMRQKDVTILRYGRQRQLCEEIITRQRQLMKDENVALPPDLQDLYTLYQQEIHYDSYADHNMNEVNSFKGSEKLPPIFNKRLFYERGKSQTSENALEDSDNSMRTPSSSAGSDWPSSPLPPITNSRYTSFPNNNGAAPTTVLFPPISRPYFD